MADKPTAPELFRGNVEEHLRKIAGVVNQVQKGYGNNAFKIMLGQAPATSTTVQRQSATVDQHANLSPISAEAAADFALGTTYAVTANGSVTVNHAAGVAGRQYGVVLAG